MYVRGRCDLGQVLGAGLLADVAAPEGTGPFPILISVHGDGGYEDIGATPAQ